MGPRTACSTPSGSTCRDERLTAAAVVAVAIAAVSVGLTTPARALAQAGTFRSDTELVALQVTVTDGQHRYVAGLEADDFSVFEEGARQPVTLFAAATAPLDLMLLLDTSGSMHSRIVVAREAAANFVRTLRPGDRAAVVLFSSSVRIAQDLTGDIPALERAIRGAQPSGGTAFHEAVYIALRELARARRAGDETRRQALVVLSDGDDNDSHVALEQVLDEARRSAVTVFTILPPSDGLVRPSDVFARQHAVGAFQLRLIADETGGRTFAPQHLDDLSGTYREIADELSQQYWLAFVPRPSSGGFRRVSVQVVTRPGLRARTRSGYYASAAQPRASDPRGPS